MAASHRPHWFDQTTQSSLIDEYAEKLDHFVETFADGKVDAAEVNAQEARVVQLMKEIEPQLSDDLHEKVTRLLCELTAYDVMRLLFEVEKARPKATFRG